MAETLSQIRKLVRDLSEVQSSDEVNDSIVDEYINNWYQNKLPGEVSLGLNRTKKLVLVPYTGSYALGDEYAAVDSVRIDDDVLMMYTDAEVFFDMYPDSYAINQTIGTGDGSTVSFGATVVQGQRLIPGTVVLSDGIETFTDNENGVLTGSAGGSGTVDYATAAIVVTFAVAPLLSAVITAVCAIMSVGTPFAVLYWHNDTDDGGGPELVFRPIPSQVYEAEINYEARPAALSSDTSIPIQREWGDLIAYGTAIDMLERFGSYEQADLLKRAYGRILDAALTREVTVMSDKRPIPRW